MSSATYSPGPGSLRAEHDLAVARRERADRLHLGARAGAQDPDLVVMARRGVGNVSEVEDDVAVGLIRREELHRPRELR